FAQDDNSFTSPMTPRLQRDYFYLADVEI
ncbi:MAG: hypothetical protein QOD80_1315, partial [Verrucomicrobiota bacterium]